MKRAIETDNQPSEKMIKSEESEVNTVDTAVNISRSSVENFNINADVYSQQQDTSNTTGVNIQMDSGGLIQNLTTNTVIQQQISSTETVALTKEDLIRCRNELRNYYKTTCKIRLLSWMKRDSRIRLKMKDLFINLYLILEVPNAIEIPVQIQDYLKLFHSEYGSLRALIRGKAGTGKTTLLQKLALDWAEGKLPESYNDIPLLFLLKMKSVKQDHTLTDAVFRQGLFGREFERLKSKLSKFIDDYPEKIILLIDAVDEYSEYGSDGYIESIIHNDSLRRAFVIVTSRPWRAFEILEKSPETYSDRNYEVKGYTQVQVNDYVKQFFEKKPEMVEKLLKQLHETGIGTGIATIPIMCMLICVLYRDLKEELPDTISGLYEMLHRRFLQHYDQDKHYLGETICEEDKLATIG